MPEPKRILAVFATFGVGGPQVRYAALANHMGAAWQHDIVAMDGNHTAAERLDPALVVRFGDPDLQKGDTRGNICRIRAYLRKIRPDVLVTHNWGSIEWAMANAISPLVRHVHIEDGFGPEERQHQLPRRVWTRRLVLRRAEIVLPSQTLLRLARDVWKLPSARLHYVPNGIDISRFAPTPNKPDNGTVVFGTIAALRPEKNISRLMHAFCQVRAAQPAQLIIVGDGPETPALRQMAASLGVANDVIFTGHLANPANVLRGFDVFVMSSDTEQMPLSVLEAMAAGLPVAATDVGDVRPMLSGANQPYVVPQDIGQLARVMQSLAEDVKLRYGIGQANRYEAEGRFDQRQMFHQYDTLFFPISAG
jgi:glycosyltransferase involved in cell wall biosynthesis